MVLYFSGTGNSKHLAKIIAQNLDDELFSINDSLKNNLTPEILGEKPLIFVTPVYSWRIPKIVQKWIINLPNIEGKKAYFVITCGQNIGNAPKYVQKSCKKANVEYMGSAEIVMPENYILMFDAPSESEQKRLIEDADKQVLNVISYIKEQKVLPKHKITFLEFIESSIVNFFFYPFCVSARKFKVDKKCVSCGRCQEVCPLNNITLSGGKPVWEKNCTHCSACINYCPTLAINYGKKTAKKRRYTFPKDYKNN